MQQDVRKLKKEIVTAPNDYGRDAGKSFLISEADAFAVEWWAWRVGLVLKGTSAFIPPDIVRLGYVGVVREALNAVLAADVDQVKLKELLDEMLTCVQAVRDRNAIDKMTGEPIATPIAPNRGDIMEVKTIGWLRSEVARVHTNFSPLEVLSALTSALAQASADSSNT